jgi:ABC-type sugar transport system permease subunit
MESTDLDKGCLLVKSQITEKIAPFLFLVPPLLIVAVIIFSICTTIYYSFTNAMLIGGGAVQFVGFKNYSDLFSDPLFYISLKNNLIFLLMLGIFPIVFGFAIALLLSMKIKGGSLFKSLFFFPLILSFIVTGSMWSWIFLSQGGLINTALNSVGLGSLAQPWLINPNLVVPSLGVVGIWQIIGLPIILFSAGLVDIPEHLLDAARMDASALQTYRYVVLPVLTPVFLGVAILLIISSWKVFDLVVILTYGGPVTSSYVLAFLVYVRALTSQQVGSGSAAATILFLLGLLCIVVLLYASKRRK